MHTCSHAKAGGQLHVAVAGTKMNDEIRQFISRRSTERRCCMIQLRREWGRFSNFSFRTPQRRISAYPARPSG